MRYAEVSVNSPAALRRTFSYSIPPGLAIKEGQAVWVPFGEKLLQGIVFSISDIPSYEETRDITGVIEPELVLSREYLDLAYWISEHYLCPLFSAINLMLPPGYDRKAVAYVRTTVPDDRDLSAQTSEKAELIDILRKAGRTQLKTLEKHFGQKRAQRLVSWLISNGHGIREYEIEPVKVRPRTETIVRPGFEPETSEEHLRELGSRSPAQRRFLDYLLRREGSTLLSEALDESGCSRAVVNTLVKKNLVTLEQRELRRDPLATHSIVPSSPLVMTRSQEEAYVQVCNSIGRSVPGKPDIFLLHGVTGSGKTEIYLRVLAETIRQGKRGIVLVPEIALTPQTIERFSSRFPGRIAILHSQLSIGERYDEWQRIQRGEADIVIGPRSALFAPQPDLGMIILDEEHEWTYKQQETPRYHAREAAVKLAELLGATVLLGSATPDVESFYRTESGRYHLLELPQRVTPFENAPLPAVEIVDLREELKAGNRSMFSRSLTRLIRSALAAEEQVMLFLNRRGAASYIQCRDCGFVLRCRRCAVPMTYHLAEDMLVCHQCNARAKSPESCPECGSRRIRYLGTGTQKLEQEARESFPGARLLRWDSDTTSGKDAHREILERFKNHEADILIGTQMITKGLDLPLVTLVGVVSSDTSLNLPDFRAGERTFQLLTQVAGRAGRGPNGGQVIIQTYTPDHYAIQAASRHDYHEMYQREISYRRELNNPPFSELASLVYRHANDEQCRQEALRMKAFISTEITARGIAGLQMIGPAPAFIHRLRGRYRWQLIVRGYGLSDLLSDVPLPRGWTVDIDPVGL